VAKWGQGERGGQKNWGGYTKSPVLRSQPGELLLRGQGPGRWVKRAKGTAFSKEEGGMLGFLGLKSLKKTGEQATSLVGNRGGGGGGEGVATTTGGGEKIPS